MCGKLGEAHTGISLSANYVGIGLAQTLLGNRPSARLASLMADDMLSMALTAATTGHELDPLHRKGQPEAVRRPSAKTNQPSNERVEYDKPIVRRAVSSTTMLMTLGTHLIVRTTIETGCARPRRWSKQGGGPSPIEGTRREVDLNVRVVHV